jgi:hypothetical protein
MRKKSCSLSINSSVFSSDFTWQRMVVQRRGWKKVWGYGTFPFSAHERVLEGSPIKTVDTDGRAACFVDVQVKPNAAQFEP